MNAPGSERGQAGRDPRCRCTAKAIAGWGKPDTHLSTCPLYIAYPADFSAAAADALRNVQCRHDDALRALDALRDQVRDFLTEWDKPNVGNPHFEIDILRRATGESGPIVPGADKPINQFRERAERYAKKGTPHDGGQEATASDRFLEAAHFSESARGIAFGLDDTESDFETSIADADRAAGRAVEALEGGRRLLKGAR